jgi:hypothetical protein
MNGIQPGRVQPPNVLNQFLPRIYALRFALAEEVLSARSASSLASGLYVSAATGMRLKTLDPGVGSAAEGIAVDRPSRGPS